MIFIDTESIGFYGPTVLFQYAVDDGPIYIHNVWEEPVIKTLTLIEKQMTYKGGICGYNLSHDSFHYARTYGVLSQLPKSRKPNLLDYRDCEQETAAKDDYCIKPCLSLDLLLHGRKGEFQSVLRQKDIILKKVPRVLAQDLVRVLHEKVQIPGIYFSKSKIGYHWRIVPLDAETFEEKANETDERKLSKDFVNLRLGFAPSAALKVIISEITGKNAITLEDLPALPSVDEHAWFPTFGGWLNVALDHIHAWRTDPRRIKYAKDDITYLRILHRYFNNPPAGDVDSNLAWMVGQIFWRGYNVDIAAAKKLYNENKKELGYAINVRSSRQVLHHLHSVCTPLEIQAIPNTKNDTLKSLLEWEDTNPELVTRVKSIIKEREKLMEQNLLEKIIAVGRLHVQFKVIGTKSNRMSGGSESYVSRGGSINPQGVKKGPGIRSIFPLYWDGMCLCGGDFDGFEVSIAEAVYNDPELRSDLLSGKKIHALFASSMYNMTYDEVIKYKDENENHPKGWYQRGKRAFFGRLYGAQTNKLMSVLWLEEEEVLAGLERFFSRYKGVKAAQDKVYEHHAALRQPKGIGTKVEWVEPKKYCESFLGFRRYFTLEYNIIQTLFNLAQDMPDRLKEKGKNISVVRRDRVQTGSGAACSALYAAAFNLQAQVTRSAANHDIQSPGGQINKELEEKIWTVQPMGISRWRVMPFNVHDEIQCPCALDAVDEVTKIVNDFVENYRSQVPLISMKWKTHLNNWAEK